MPQVSKWVQTFNKPQQSLQHRHFAFIAGVIADIGADDIRATTAIRFAGECQATNSNFDWERFRETHQSKMEASAEAEEKN